MDLDPTTCLVGIRHRLLPRCHDRSAARQVPHLPITASIRAAGSHGRTPKKKATRPSLHLNAWLLSPLHKRAASNRSPSRRPYRATSSDELVSTAEEVSSASQAPSGLSSNGKVIILRNIPGATVRLEVGEHGMGASCQQPWQKLGLLLTTSTAGRACEACRSARPIRC